MRKHEKAHATVRVTCCARDDSCEEKEINNGRKFAEDLWFRRVWGSSTVSQTAYFDLCFSVAVIAAAARLDAKISSFYSATAGRCDSSHDDQEENGNSHLSCVCMVQILAAFGITRKLLVIFSLMLRFWRKTLSKTLKIITLNIYFIFYCLCILYYSVVVFYFRNKYVTLFPHIVILLLYRGWLWFSR